MHVKLVMRAQIRLKDYILSKFFFYCWDKNLHITHFSYHML